MRKIIVFTKKGSLNAAFDDIADEREDLKMLDGTKATKLLFDEVAAQFKPVNDFSSFGLYLIYDLISETEFNSFVNKFDKSEVFVLKHGKPLFSLEGFACVEKGVTEQSEKGGKYYPEFVEIICDANSQKVERIFKSIFPFDKKDVDSADDFFNSLYKRKGKAKQNNNTNTKRKKS